MQLWENDLHVSNSKSFVDKFGHFKQFDKVVAACNFALIARVGVIRLEQAAARCVRCSQGAPCHCRQPCSVNAQIEAKLLHAFAVAP